MTVSEIRSLLELLDASHRDGDGIADQRVVILVQAVHALLNALPSWDWRAASFDYWLRSAVEVRS